MLKSKNKKEKAKSSKSKFPKSKKSSVDLNDSTPTSTSTPSDKVREFMNEIGPLTYVDKFSNFGLIPKKLGINRTINKDHVNTLATIISNGNNLWNPIFVVENKFKIKANFFNDNQMKNIEQNSDGTYSIIDDEGNIPRYIIIDGQHRYEAFKLVNTRFPYYDVTDVLQINFVEEIINHVNNFNIGAKNYTTKLITEKNAKINPYLRYFNEITKDVIIEQQKDRSVRKENSDHVKKLIKTPLNKSPYKIAFINKGTSGALKREINIHEKTKYMSVEPISDELKKHMRDMVLTFQMINRLMEGYTPYSITVYKFLSDIKGKINYNNITFQKFLIMLEKELMFEKDLFIESRNYDLDTKIQIKDLTDYLFRNMNQQVLRMLTNSGVKFTYDKTNNTFDI